VHSKQLPMVGHVAHSSRQLSGLQQQHQNLSISAV
jgi:hypothetical protein